MKITTLSIMVANHYGVLSRIANLFTRRRLNIKAFSANETENPDFTRITILTDSDESEVEQIRRLLDKLEDVVWARVIPPDRLVGRETILLRMREEEMDGMTEVLSHWGGEVLLHKDGSVFVTLTTTVEKIEDFIDEMEPFGILALSRTGGAALEVK